MAKYVRLKDRKSSRGVAIDGVLYNNATVVKYEKALPAAVTTAIRNQILEECKAINYTNFVKGQEKAAAEGKKVRDARNLQYIRRVAAKTGETEEKVAEKKTRSRKKKTEEKKQNGKKTEAPKDTKEKSEDSGEASDNK